MKSLARTRSATAPPGVVATARVARRAGALLPRLRPGDVAVIDHLDLDRDTARALLDAGVGAVLNASPMLSGRYPSQGAALLADAGVLLVEDAGAALLADVRDASVVRIHDGVVHAGAEPDAPAVATGQVVDAETLRARMEQARLGLTAQLDSFTRNAAEFLRQEEDLLLHGRGLPRLATRMAGRSVVVVVQGHDHAAELHAARVWLREQAPVVVAVGRAGDDLRERRQRVDVLVVDAADEAAMPSAQTLKSAREVVLRVERGRAAPVDPLMRMGISPSVVTTGATAEDVALLLAAAGDAALVVGVGMNATLTEFLDRQRSGLPSTFLTRLKLGPLLVDAAAVPRLYSGRVRPHHLLLVMLSGLVALAAAVGVTPVGQEWFDQLSTLFEGILG
ncbi:putative cytokinetic ring protein SteA [Nocardioides ochotonae]|uniref:putative cytokinetic ring protein SteA n=1 Tax=Nocardioides ochotonae TaxID=2685869 RepID=UPI00140B2BDC|nr:putative cytokinetic ring protein SteA [Nocardioides ochotonae]